MSFLNSDFVHLHCHSEYSRFDGLARIDSFTLTAKLMGFPAIGLTDHGNIGGWIKFYQSCDAKKKKYKIDFLSDRELLKATKVKYTIHKDKKTGEDSEIELHDAAPLKPILGEEFYLARNHEVGGKEGNPDGSKGNKHLLLLAKNHEGYKNLCTLSQRSWTHGQYMNPRIDLNLLAEHSKGLICSSACIGSVVNQNLLHGRFDKAKQIATLLKDIFGEDFYLATMFHGYDDEAAIIADQIRLSRLLGIPLVAENDCHCCTKNQMASQTLLMAMSSSRCIKDPKAYGHPYPELYMKSHAEMAKMFGHYPEVLSNTRMIAEKIGDCIERKVMRLPKFDIEGARKEAVILQEPESDHEKGKRYLDDIMSKTVTLDSAGEIESGDEIFERAYAFMVELAEKGMKKLGWHKSPEHIEALKMELSDVRIAWESNRMDFATYFLIVWDYINFCRSKKILTGCGRGSGYASLLLRTLGITYGPDPLKYGLIWERFLGFDDRYFLNDHDWGFGEAATEELEPALVAGADEDEEDLFAERAVEDDQGGQDRY